jgi:hypothetical protein
MSKPIQFLLHQLANNEQDRERFNLISKEFRFAQEKEALGGFEWFNSSFVTYFGERIGIYTEVGLLPDLLKSCFIRTCLSRVNGKAVLGVLEGKYEEAVLRVFEGKYEDTQIIMNKTELLYLAFDHPLRNGKTLDEAILALHEKMIELVPEYVEFCKNLFI